MYKFIIGGIENTNQYEELIKVFLTQEEYVLISREDMQSADFQKNSKVQSRMSLRNSYSREIRTS